MPNPSKTGADHIAKVDRQIQALNMRRAGKPVPEIAAILGVGTTTIYKYIQDGLRDASREAAEDHIALHISRCEAMISGAWADARSGDTKAMGAVLKVMEREAKLLGLDLYAAQKAINEGKDPAAVDKWLEHMVGKAVEDAL